MNDEEFSPRVDARRSGGCMLSARAFARNLQARVAPDRALAQTIAAQPRLLRDIVVERPRPLRIALHSGSKP